MKLTITLLFLFLHYTSAQSQNTVDTVVLSENFVDKLVSETTPNIQQIEASYLSVKKSYLALEDALSFSLDSESSVYESKERLLSAFDGGVTNNYNSFSLGINKPTSYGVDFELSAFSEKTTNAFISGAAKAGMSLSMTMDLFEDFLGRKTRSNLKTSYLELKRAELEKKVNQKTFYSNLKKIYWGLVANSERKRLLTTLAELAKTQFEEAKRRKKSGVADSGEVARYRSQWTTRKASLLSLKYQRGEIIKSLKELIPELNDKNIELAPYSVDKTIVEVLSCSAQIASYKEAPFQFTPYDEIVSFLKEEEVLSQKVNETYDNPTVKLVGEYSNVGRDYGISNARSNFNSDGRDVTSLTLQVSIPFGGRKRKTEEVLKEMTKKSYRAKAQSYLSRIRSYHTETARIITILKDVVQNQRETNYHLAQSIKVSQRKFKQARISVQELISEQDAHLESQLNEIQTNLTIINTLMDYFSIYTDIPCEINRT